MMCVWMVDLLSERAWTGGRGGREKPNKHGAILCLHSFNSLISLRFIFPSYFHHKFLFFFLPLSLSLSMSLSLSPSHHICDPYLATPFQISLPPSLPLLPRYTIYPQCLPPSLGTLSQPGLPPLSRWAIPTRSATPPSLDHPSFSLSVLC